ncbi:protoporphyrinogen/coproporphyrinogen oxidase [Congregicoccus parvus]|uniref:protoporphyrinogen/coproporphyrinogen oxidase n=1 Tax=Congregicoccus parvus TaxID=3081749 RepID=UPI003FA60A8B
MSDVVIIGAGLAGLCCALRLQEAGVDYVVVEAGDRVGGRVRTEVSGGFRFDRGFQVFLSSYPEARRVLDFAALDLRYFEPGCLIASEGRLHPFVDPWRRPSALWKSVFGPFGTLGDKLRVARLRWRVTRPSIEQLLAQPDTTTDATLKAQGFGEEIVDAFFRPFLGGVFLDSELQTSSRKFRWLFRMFSRGRAAVPALGMGEIPRQLAARLPSERIRLNTKATQVTEGRVVLEDGRDLLCSQVVVATDPGTAIRLIEGLPPVAFRSVTNLQYSLADVPTKGAWLVVNGDGSGLVNNLAFMSEVSSEYAPKGRALASVSVLGCPELDDRALDDLVRQELVRWFGMIVGEWRLECVHRLREALPDQPAGSLGEVRRGARLQDWLVVAGDWRNLASINGAMESGRLAAEAVLEKVLD